MLQASRIQDWEEGCCPWVSPGPLGQTHQRRIKIPRYRQKKLGVSVQRVQVFFDFGVVNTTMELVQIIVGWFSFFILVNDVQSSQLQRDWDFNFSFEIFTFFNFITILTPSSYWEGCSLGQLTWCCVNGDEQSKRKNWVWLEHRQTALFYLVPGE